MVVGRPATIQRDPSKIMRTANELHLPVGVPARIILQSNDVIHSFWVPNLAGKQDLIPGRENDITLRAAARSASTAASAPNFAGCSTPTWRSIVIVEQPCRLRQLVAAASCAPPFAPPTPLAQAGYDLCHQRQCSTCHNIAGTPAAARVGARPHPFRQPPHDRRRHAADEPGQPLRLGRRPAVAQARQQHADDRTRARASCTPSSPIWRR